MIEYDPTSGAPFGFLKTKSGLIQISYRGKVVTSLAGKTALRFLTKVNSTDPRGAQLAMAKATGHFKHENQKMSKEKGKGR